ncbi:MAG: class I SAM-dependent methyltransferase [Candidatus Saccharimonadales bacterium]|jgi:ubiquinone/menaquinone biosynthesis C-methylase UbiE
MKDWQEWHNHYNEPSSDLAKRLQIVQEQIDNCLPRDINEPYQIIDICAGDGRDLIGVLSKYPNLLNIRSFLVEINDEIANQAKELINTEHIQNIQVVIADAANSSLYKNVIPADLILLCGVFGNISIEDVRYIIKNLSMFCKSGTKVIWTRNRRVPDVTPKIRELFTNNSLDELKFISTSDNTYAVGLNIFNGNTKPFNPELKLFTFIR